jgi:Holliday junction resolvase RusA-like endonuclease
MSLGFGETEYELSASFTVDGAPQGKARPRVTRHGTYTPAKTKEYEKAVQWSYMMQCQGAMFPDCPLQVVIDAYFPIPKSASKRKRQEMNDDIIRPKVKPDLDNIAKAICDALNGEAWHDDAQIVNLYVRKWYSDKPRVDVQIRTVGE